MNDLPFETLIESNNSKNRWYPTPIETFRNNIKIDNSIENATALLSNLAYNLQYIEFLEKELEELKLSNVISTMVVKNYVITGVSILEGLFSNIIKSNGWWKTSNLISLGATTSNETDFAGQKYVIKTEIFRKTDSYYMLQMNLADLIKILDKHHKALEVDHRIYPALKRLKDLRNRVHLQISEGDKDHDYNAFNFAVKKQMSEILHDILTSPIITDRPEIFDFIKTESSRED